MKTLLERALYAKTMLGDSGEVARIAALALVYPCSKGWIVRAFDCEWVSDQEITAFLGPTAKQRATEYAAEKYSGVKLLELTPK